MNFPFTNIHTHVFTGSCAPDRFLMIIPMGFLRKNPKNTKRILESRVGRWIIHNTYKLTESKESVKRKKLDKFLSFLDVGTNATQQQIFEAALDVGKKLDPSIRIIGLTLNMDHMDSQVSSGQKSFDTQLEEVKAIKRYYPKNFFPFLSIDPRAHSNSELVNWATPYFESGVVTNDVKVYPYFSGLKMYPALGFFPFDVRLEEIYRYAEQNQLPVVTHCTRSGSQYVGSSIETLIPRNPSMLMPANPVRAQQARDEIYERINRYYTHSDNKPNSKQPWLLNNNWGRNDRACDLFGHPQNYIPVLEAFPNLKICLAHLGGSDEIFCDAKDRLKELALVHQMDGYNWFDLISRMMLDYKNLYADISYTVADFDRPPILNRVIQLLTTPDPHRPGEFLGDRILFGTDFFMTEQEKRESELYDLARQKLTDPQNALLQNINWFDKISRINTQKFLLQPL